MAPNEEGRKQETAVVEALKAYRRDWYADLLTLLLGGFIYLCWQLDVKELLILSHYLNTPANEDVRRS
jgi:hypothetical protein